MVRIALARSHALISIVIVGGCVLPAPLGSLDTGSSGAATEGESQTATADGSTSASVGDTGDDNVPNLGPAPVGPDKLDILFVLDNSGSMAEEQTALVGSIDQLVAALDGLDGLSYRIAVTTTDNGNPWCGSTSPEAGRLLATSCRERTGQFIFNGNPPADATASACTDICQLDTLAIAETPVAGESGVRRRSWIEAGDGVTNLQGVPVVDALRCMLPQGIAGCGFEQPLESARKTILRSQNPDEDDFGFVREDAHLAVIFVSDESDCSYASEQDWIFLPEPNGGDPSVFWSDPDASAPTSAVCWNAGVECQGSGQPYDECHAANKSAAGAGVPDDAAVLEPLDRYIDAFADLLARKRAMADASVFLYGVLGVPSGYPANPLVFESSSDPLLQIEFGIAPGCQGPTGSAVPPVRELGVIEAFQYANLAGPQVFSICDPAFGGVYSQLIAQITPFVGE